MGLLFFTFFKVQLHVINKMHADCLNGHNDFYSQNFINIDGINL